MNYNLSTIGLYVLSGAPASGKSTFLKNLKNLPKEAIISSDSLREQIFGSSQSIDSNGKISKLLNSNGDRAVFSIMEQIVEERLKENLLTIVDSTNTTEKERLFWAKIANKYSIPTTVLIFDSSLEDLVDRDSKRLASVGFDVVKKFKDKLNLSSSLPFINVQEHDSFNLLPPTIPDNVDVIGDTHGLYDDMVHLLGELGYFIENGFLSHPDNRKVLFLGDWTDRGFDSVKCFDLIYNSVVQNNHFAICGNHEHKLMKIYEKWKNDKVYTPKSFSGAETMVSFWENVNSEKLDSWMSWLKTLPHYYVNNRFVFTHADIASVNIYQLPASSAYYGESKWGKINTDESFTKWSQELGFDGPILIRGHIPQLNVENKSSRVFSLEEKVGFNGTIKALQLDKALNAINSKSWLLNSSDFSSGLKESNKILSNDKYVAEKIKSCILEKSTNFNYSMHQKNAMKTISELNKLHDEGKVNSTQENLYGFKIFNEKSNSMTPKQKEELLDLETRKLVQHKTNSEGLEIYKYSKKVFFDALWDESPLLMHARGLVLDQAGKIIQNPFVKIFNYGEKGAGSDLPDSHPVRAVEKMNGFLGCITNHPYEKSNLLVTTTGSFDSDFVGYINDFIDEDTKKKFNMHCVNTGETLMFEVIHPKDPHIIPYKEEEHGLYLIGARKKELNSPLVSEETLDEYAKQLNLKRPKYFDTTLGEIRKLADEVKHEGFIVRDLLTDEPLLKFKTSHYLTVKFLGRMGQGQSKLMFEKPEFFKQKIDEEYYPIVDLIVKNSNFSDFTSMKSEDRVPFIHTLIKKMWDDIHPTEQPTFKVKP